MDNYRGLSTNNYVIFPGVFREYFKILLSRNHQKANDFKTEQAIVQNFWNSILFSRSKFKIPKLFETLPENKAISGLFRKSRRHTSSVTGAEAKL